MTEPRKELDDVRLGAEAGAAIGGLGSIPPTGDDRFLPLFRRLASPQALPATVEAMARAFALHAPDFGQDASKPRIAEFVAQIANETGGFTRFEENLNYSAKRLTEVWPSRFPTIAAATPYARNPEALANRTYGSRGGNRGEASGDGWRYRGRGALQLTFRDNYRLYGELTGLPLEERPELAADPTDSVLIALAFFKRGKVNDAIDRGDFREARRITNGAALGLKEVALLRAIALQALA
jgi:putative chitinase